MESQMLESLRDAMHYNPDTGRNFDDIEKVLAGWFVEPEGYDDADGVWIVRFKDGSERALFGWHDSTGWFCQSGLDLFPVEGWEERVRAEHTQYGLSADEVIASIRAQLVEAGE